MSSPYSNDNLRPDPDALLAQLQVQESLAGRGKLRIYFGASAGVGKTYAMLGAAHKLHSEGREVLAGVIESHGRAETAAMLNGLELLPMKQVAYRDKQLPEFDLDAALQRKPSLILVDELAHSNASGSRHPKRWQDVEELLNAGIDVFTTLNVQHLESLNDVVGGITGIRVAETLPDTVFDAADEVVLVDLPADELLNRLKLGKVYKLPQAERASRNFFRKGNLIALRELALRRTADRLQGDVQAYRIEKSIGAVWQTDAALLACVGPSPSAEHVIRSTARLATQLNAEWHAVYVETPRLQRFPSAKRERILKTLKLAQDLGATTAVLAGNEVAAVMAGYARSHNFSKIIIGRSQRRFPWQASHSARIAALASDIDLIEIGVPPTRAAEKQEEAAGKIMPRHVPMQSRIEWWGYLWALAVCVLVTLLATPILPFFDLANIVMLYLLAEVLIAIRFGRGPAIFVALLSIASFDFFFVPPRFSFAVSDFQYLLTFGVMLAVGLTITHLTAGLRYQARIASDREARSRALFEFARALSGVLQTEQIFETSRLFLQRSFQAKTLLLIPDDAGRLQMPAVIPDDVANVASALDMGIAQWAFDNASSAGIGTDTLPASSYLYLPLVAPMRTRGVLVILPYSRRWILIPEQQQQLYTFATLTAIALERVHYVEVAQDALVRMESERLRNSLLSALSHDLRTPLTALIGLSESLVLSKPPLQQHQQVLAGALHSEMLRMSALVTNLLDMARIQSGEVKLNLQWQPFEEVVGSALRASGSALLGHGVEIRVAHELPLIRFDAVLIERVLCNLLENAAKYTPAGSHIVLAAMVNGRFLAVTVADDGPGLPAGMEDAIFEKFTRGERESAKPGVGLGLAICRAIVEAHGGTIHARSVQSGHHGAEFIFTIPLGTPPSMPDPEEHEPSVGDDAEKA
ncbi:two-component system, OmpR family, sensor histidine kinase KdpD [Collimonas sp. OK607]|uniref:two-component system sensor histidine kinase KdpD n=1 Tax=Collimonas sp. OK607 TaxID=1798194 RepID=UPI0008F30102|nr:two-component system sensor histidine kinase KdpD [Collimonas sp. OK607]SFB20446.1 two-component system, OmpR family, sensor histidine kinase KdpD [Collimonas sp. OK607]